MIQLNESFDDAARSPCSSTHGSLAASVVSGITSRSRGVQQGRGGGVAGADTVADDLDSMSVVTGISSVACSRCSYVTGCDVSDSVSNVFATTASQVSCCSRVYVSRDVNKARGVKAKAKASKPRPRPRTETCKTEAKAKAGDMQDQGQGHRPKAKAKADNAKVN